MRIPTALFGYAAWCLASLDPSSNDVLVRYGKLVDTDHENFYFEKTVPLMLENAKDASDRLQLAEGLYFGDLGNAVDYSTFWRMAEMAESAAATMTPGQYACKNDGACSKDLSMTRSPSDLGYYCFDYLARDLKDTSDWEKALLQEIRGAVTDLLLNSSPKGGSAKHNPPSRSQPCETVVEPGDRHAGRQPEHAAEHAREMRRIGETGIDRGRPHQFALRPCSPRHAAAPTTA